MPPINIKVLFLHVGVDAAAGVNFLLPDTLGMIARPGATQTVIAYKAPSDKYVIYAAMQRRMHKCGAYSAPLPLICFAEK